MDTTSDPPPARCEECGRLTWQCRCPLPGQIDLLDLVEP